MSSAENLSLSDLERRRELSRRRAARYRVNPENRIVRISQSYEQMRIRRENESLRLSDRLRNTAQRRVSRANEEVRARERNVRRNIHINARNVANENRRMHRNHLKSYENLSIAFNVAITEGPVHNCICCDRLFFKKSMNPTTMRFFRTKGLSDAFVQNLILIQIENDEQALKLCNTCFRSLSNKKVPSFCVKNGLEFQPIPPELRVLSPLEERCVSLRIPFMKIYALGVDRQYGIRGGVVNVPLDVRQTVTAIPIDYSETRTIQLRLKRRMQYTGHVYSETVSPRNILQATNHLLTTPLYEGINFDATWATRNGEEFNAHFGDLNLNVDNPSRLEIDQQIEEFNEENEVNPLNAQALYEETLLDRNFSIEFAPGEGQIPMSLLLDQFAEEMAFPTIYCGHPRGDTALSYFSISNSEIRRSDRRAVRPDHLLYVYKKLQVYTINSSIQTAMRMRRSVSNATVANVMDAAFIEEMARNDDGYNFLCSVKGSPAYLQKQKKNINSMIRQLGIPTLFITLSAAESKWKELLKILKLTVDKEENANVDNLEFMEIARLIRFDPVTCAQYFEHRFKELMKTWKSLNNGPFGEYVLLDSYYRIEFQHRGSPHVHMIVWLQNAPKFIEGDDNSYNSIANFVDQIISTNSNHVGLNNDLINLQRHRCTVSCRKRVSGNVKCRYNFPFFPVDKTVVLDKYTPANVREVQYLAGIVAHIKELMDNLPNDIVDFASLLTKLNCSRENYLKALQTTIDRTKVFVKRNPCDARINNFSPKIINLMQSNMDIQFVLDGYSCAAYIVDYINKSNRGISRLLRTCQEEVAAGNLSIHNRLKKLGNVFLNGSEVSAQEAAWTILRLPMTYSSRQVVYINTSPANQRTRIVRRRAVLEQQNEDSTDIFENGIIEKYIVRPLAMENVCLADFTAEYSFVSSRPRVLNEDDVNEDNDDEDVVPNMEFQLTDRSGVMRKRKKFRIIRYRNYNILQDCSNHLRELLMLFHPWRNESVELQNIDFFVMYQLHKITIDELRKKYVTCNLNLEEIYQQLEENRQIQENFLNNEPNLQNDQRLPDEINPYEPIRDIQQDINIELGEEEVPVENVRHFTYPDQISEIDYLQLINGLNVKQRDYLMDVMSKVKSNSDIPIYEIICGKAGAGKSYLIKALYQSLIRYYRSQIGGHENIEVLLTAPTGKAAHNIGGMTLHSALQLPVSQCPTGSERQLAADVANTLLNKLFHLKVIIIDEISMVGSKMLNNVNKRLQQIFRSEQPFASKSIIVLGDFRQLRPIGDKYIFAASGLASITGNPLWNLFQMFELTEIMRQRNDLTFAETLTRLGDGVMTTEDVLLINTRCFLTREALSDRARSAINLFTTRAGANQYNTQRMLELRNPGTAHATVHAFDVAMGSRNENDRARILATAQGLDVQSCYGLPYKLELQINIRYMITTNVNVEDGIFNGATGLLRQFDVGRNATSNEDSVIYCWIEFDDISIGKQARLSMASYMQNHRIPLDWTPILKHKRVFKIDRTGHKQVTREQFPLTVSEAITIHKSQGSSMETVVVHLSARMERASLYVACSRVTKLEGLSIVGRFKAPSKPKNTHEPTMEMARLRENIKIPKFNFLHKCFSENIRPNFIQIAFHNIQSLNKYKGNIEVDLVYKSSQILLFAETRTKLHDQFDFSGFTEVTRTNCNYGEGRNDGVAAFVSTLLASLVENVFTYNIPRKIQIAGFSFKEPFLFTFIVVYRHPNSSMEIFKHAMRTQLANLNSDKMIVCGDFNSNVRDSQALNSIMDEFNLILLSNVNEYTTNNHTTLDVVYVTQSLIIDMSCHVYEHLFSYHKPIIARLYEN